MSGNILKSVREAAKKKILFLPHALDQMNRPDRLITPSDVRMVILQGGVIEDYPEDSRGYSCLMFGLGGGDRPIHVVCSPKIDFLAIITAYLPDEDKWSKDFRRSL